MNLEQKKCFALRLSVLREKKGLTQQALADETNILRVTIAKYESQKRIPSYEDLTTLAKYFNTSTDYLLGITDIPRIETPLDEKKKIICDYTGLNTEAVNKLLQLKLAGYEKTLCDLLNSPNTGNVLDAVKQVYISCDDFFDNESKIAKSIFDEMTKDFIDLYSLDESFRTLLESTYLQRENIEITCIDKLNEQIGYPLYKCAKAVEQKIDMIIKTKYDTQIKELINNVLCIISSEEAPDNGSDTTKEE